MRVAALAAVTVGMLAGSAGVTLGVGTLVQKGSASGVQYGQVAPPPADEGGVAEEGGDDGGVLGISDEGTGDSDRGGDSADGQASETQPTAQIADGQASAIQPTAQIAAVGDDSLPFTGYLAIPALGIGLLLTAGGMVLLRKHPARTRT